MRSFVAIALMCLVATSMTAGPDMQKCISDMSSLLPQVAAAAQAGDWQKLLALANQAIPTINDCTGQDFSRYNTCVQDIVNLVPEVVAAIQSKDMSKILDIIAKGQKAAADCQPQSKIANHLMLAVRGDMATCIADMQALLPKLAHAIQTFSVPELMALIPDFQKAFTDCNMGNLALRVQDMPHCIQDLMALIPEVMDAIKNKDMSKIMDIVQKAQQAWTDCSSGNKLALRAVQDIPTCISDLMALIPEVIDAIKNKDMSKIMDIIAKAQAAWKDCSSGNRLTLRAVTDIPTCISDLMALVPEVIDAIKNKDMSKIMDIIAKAQAAWKDCSSGKKFVLGAAQGLRDMPHCIQDLAALIPEVIDAIKNKDMSKIMDIVQKAQQAWTDCSSATKRRHLLMRIRGSCPCNDAIQKVLPDVQEWLQHAGHGDWDLNTWMQQLPKLMADLQTVQQGCMPSQ